MIPLFADLDFSHILIVASIKAVCNPQDPGQFSDSLLNLLLKSVILLMTCVRCSSSVISGCMGHDVDLLFCKPSSISIPNKIEGMFMMLPVGDKVADIVHESGKFKQLPICLT